MDERRGGIGPPGGRRTSDGVPPAPRLTSPPSQSFDRSRADVAQLVEQLIRNQQVGGSSPPVGSIFSRTYAIAASRFAAPEAQRKQLETALRVVRQERSLAAVPPPRATNCAPPGLWRAREHASDRHAPCGEQAHGTAPDRTRRRPATGSQRANAAEVAPAGQRSGIPQAGARGALRPCRSRAVPRVRSTEIHLGPGFMRPRRWRSTFPLRTSTPWGSVMPIWVRATAARGLRGSPRRYEQLACQTRIEILRPPRGAGEARSGAPPREGREFRALADGCDGTRTRDQAA